MARSQNSSHTPRAVPPAAETGFYGAYTVFAQNLRLWLLAYGVGLPVLFFQSEAAWTALGTKGVVRPFVYFFLGGIALQVVSAVLYKSAMWYLYMGELGEIGEKTKRHTWSEAVSTAYWLEFLIDVATIVVFAWATILALGIIVR